MTEAPLEVLVAYRPRFTFDGRANFLDPDRRQSVSADLVLAVWDPGRVCRSPRIGVRPLGPFTLRTEGITRPVPHHRVAQEPADVNVIPARHDPRDQSVTGKGIVWKQAQDLVEYECC